MLADINYLANIWWQWMSAMFWQASLFILLISAIDLVIRRWAWPQVRYALWLLVLLKLIVPPTWSLSSSAISQLNPHFDKQITFIEQAEIFTKNTTKDKPANSNFPNESQTTNSLSDAPLNPKEAGFTNAWKVYILGIWILGVLIFSFLLIMNMFKLRKWHQQYKENEKIPVWFTELLINTSTQLGLIRLPALVFSEKAVTPAVYGLVRPVMLLPANYLKDLSQNDAKHVLIHELSHLKRGDLWMHGLCLALQVIYWFNPLLIWVRREMKHVREICCDLTVAKTLGEKTKHYRQTLLNTARELLTESVEPGLGFLGVFEEPFRLVSRLQWLEKKTLINRKLIISTSVLVSLFIILAFMPMAGIENESNNSLNPTDSEGTGLTNDVNLSIQPVDSSESEDFFDRFLKVFRSEPKPIFKVNQVNSFWAIILPVTGTTEQMPIVFEKLGNYMQANSIAALGNPFIRKYDDEDVVGIINLRWEAAYRIRDSIAVKAPFKVIHIPKRNILAVRVGQNFDQKAWNIKATSWLYHNDYRSLPPHHLYWTNGIYQPGKARPPFNFEIEVCKFDEPIPEVDVYTRSMRGRHELILDMKGSHDKENEALLRIQEYVKKQNIETLSPPFVRYFNTPEWTAIEDLKWHVGIAIENQKKVNEPFHIEWKDGCRLACTTYKGIHSEIPLNYWHGFMLTFSMNGYKANGVPMKFMRKKLEDDQYAVELQWPVRKW